MRVDVKALTHWVIYKGYRVRFTRRGADRVEGVLTAQDGVEFAFAYDPIAHCVHLPSERITINDFGWELEHLRDESSACE